MRRRRPALRAGYDRHDRYDRYLPLFLTFFFHPPAGLYIATHTPLILSINIYICVISALPALTSVFIGASERADIGQIFDICPSA